MASYAWAFGDGTTGTGRTTTHAYAAAGTFAVSLTVTDDKGLATTTTSQVTVQAPASNVLAQDSFGRAVATGWGTADLGGAWRVTGGTAIVKVQDGTGQVVSPKGETRTMTLDAVSTTSSDVSATFSLDSVPTGGGSYTRVNSRQVGSAFYQTQVWIKATGQIQLVQSEGATTVGSYILPGTTYQAGQQLRVRVLTTGTSPTTVKAKVWVAGQAEPAAWQTSVTSSTAALQAAGTVGIQTYLSGSATAPVTTRIDDLVVARDGQAPAPVPANQAPTAAFTSTANGLTASFDGSTSADADGTVASYAWAFGDGTTGTGKTATHAYAAAGTYAVSLTVTDDKGLASAKKDGTVTVTAPVVAPPAAGILAQDTFTRTAVNGWGTAETGGAWRITGNASILKVADGKAQVASPAGETRTASLDAVSTTASDAQVSFALDKVPTGGGAYVRINSRQVGTSYYQTQVWVRSTGQVMIVQSENGTNLKSVVVPNVTYTAGQQLRVRVQVTGTSPTTMNAKVWPVGQAEPTAWQSTTTGTLAALQTAGTFGIQTYLSSSAAGPVAFTLDDLVVTDGTAR